MKTAFYPIRVRYSSENEINDKEKYLLFERYHRDTKRYEIMQLFPLEYLPQFNSYAIPVEAIRYITHIQSYGYTLNILPPINLPYNIL